MKIAVDKIVNDPSLRTLAYKIIDETIAVANADMLRNGASEEELLGEETRDEMMTLSDGMGPYKPSTMLDFHARKPMEVKYLFRRAVSHYSHVLGI
jgi:ketopantoate reductase